MVQTGATIDVYIPRRKEMQDYLVANGWHFNEKMAKFAASLMTKKMPNGEEEPIQSYSVEQVDDMLNRFNVTVKNKPKTHHDYLYVANMAKADFLKSSITDDQHLALYVKDVIDDVDAPDGMVFAMWYAKMQRAGISIPWERCL